jgi:prepilin-type N-terminal cleavage/methylation domain-containing protein
MRRAAFTLIELLMVLTILVVLAGVLQPAVAKVQRSAGKVRCLSSLRQVSMGLVGYAQDNSGCLPTKSVQRSMAPRPRAC